MPRRATRAGSWSRTATTVRPTTTEPEAGAARGRSARRRPAPLPRAGCAHALRRRRRAARPLRGLRLRRPAVPRPPRRRAGRCSSRRCCTTSPRPPTGGARARRSPSASAPRSASASPPTTSTSSSPRSCGRSGSWRRPTDRARRSPRPTRCWRCATAASSSPRAPSGASRACSRRCSPRRSSRSSLLGAAGLRRLRVPRGRRRRRPAPGAVRAGAAARPVRGDDPRDGVSRGRPRERLPLRRRAAGRDGRRDLPRLAGVLLRRHRRLPARPPRAPADRLRRRLLQRGLLRRSSPALYLATRFEPLILLLVTQHLLVLQQLLPLLRFDGYYVLSDLTGVPDVLGRVKPVLRSLLPGRGDEPRVEGAQAVRRGGRSACTCSRSCRCSAGCS